MKAECKKTKHFYPMIPGDAEDETSNSRNLALLADELKKMPPSREDLKLLMYRTFSLRRPIILGSDCSKSMLKEYPWLKRSVCVSGCQLSSDQLFSLLCIHIGYFGIWNHYATP